LVPANDNRIGEIEQIVARYGGQFFGGKDLATPDPIYAEALKPSGRSFRTDMVAIADTAGFTGSIPFRHSCPAA